MRRIVYKGRFRSHGEEHVLVDMKLGKQASHYVTRVLRLRAGVEIEVSDDDGRVALGTLEWIEGQPWVCQAEEMVPEANLTPRVLIAALIKQRRWEWMLEKATELGATRVVPLITQHTIVTIPPQKEEARIARWQRIADEASKQCRRTSRLEVCPPIHIGEVGESAEGTLLLLDEGSTTSGWPAIANTPVTILVGPEGGWAPSEREVLLAAGAHAVGLGSLILRAETAAIAALAHLVITNETVDS